MYILVPELQIYFSLFITSSVLNKNKTMYPSTLDPLYLTNVKSFIQMLFDDNYPHTSYSYLYREAPISEWPLPVQTRLSIFCGQSKYYICDSTSCNINAFSLQADDLQMLDKLLEYRIDSTSTNTIEIDYSNLTTRLSKLIYIYLSLKINGDYSLYNTTTLIADPLNVLECTYENYVMENVYNYVSSIEAISSQPS